MIVALAEAANEARCLVDRARRRISGSGGIGHGDDRTQKYRSGGCEVERKYGSGKYESKVECKPGYGGTRLSAGEGKEEFKRNGCEVKREWKKNGEYKEEIKCD